MTVQRIIHEKGSEVTTVTPGVTIAEAAAILSRRRIGAVVVVEGDKVCGILSERDIVRALAQEGAEIMGTSQRVADVMTIGVATCSMDDNIKAVMAEMTRRRFRHLPVIEEGRLAGIVSIGDVVKSRLGEMELETVMLREAYIAAH